MSNKDLSKVAGGIARAASLSDTRKKEIASMAAKARWNKTNPIRGKYMKHMVLVPPASLKTIDPQQGVLDLQIQLQKEIDGVGMGVLTDGTPFLTGRGLARLCGVSNARLVELSADWTTEPLTPLVGSVRTILSRRGVVMDKPHIEIKQRSGDFYAYPDTICLAVLEHYAFDASRTREQAKNNFRLLAGRAFKDFIYTQVGYDPESKIPDQWLKFHDRVSLTYNSVPAGYFGIFKEMADMIVTLGQAGAHIDEHFVPDISVGMAWAKHWNERDLRSLFGDRIKYEHNYPEYFPQSASNPQEPWCYPEVALGEFRRWMREDYVGAGKFQKYLNGKVSNAELPASFAQLAISAYSDRK